MNNTHEIDFWFDVEKYGNYVSEGTFNIDLIKLASIRRSISNFVRVLTRRSIPVMFLDESHNKKSRGDIIYLTSNINNKEDFDVTVGAALHEGAHSLLTDYDVIDTTFANIPSNLFKLADKKNIRLNSLEKFLYSLLNIVEDRYIDNFVFKRSVGYRGYYRALYNRHWDNPLIDELLASDEYKWPSLESYIFRIGNLTNVNTNLNALPRLDEIVDVFDLSNLERLEYTEDRVNVAFQIAEIVLDCVDEIPDSSPMAAGEEGDEKSDKDNGDNGDNGDVGTKMISEISDILGGRTKNSDFFKDNYDAVSRISKDESEKLRGIRDKISERQKNFLMGKLEKEPVSKETKQVLDLIEDHGISFSEVGEDTFKVNCIVVNKMTKSLIAKGRSTFPLSDFNSNDGIVLIPNLKNAESVLTGIRLGKKLGRLLRLRSEINTEKFIRKKSGKINKRQLHEAAFDADDIFFKINTLLFNTASLHITVDASSSMKGPKWNQTMTAVVAICKAASMANNIHVTVSFRTTFSDHVQDLPYVVLAYDSNVDKFSKVKQLFPFLSPYGCTPEGLAIEAIMNSFVSISTDVSDRYFLNLSDGEPFFVIRHATATSKAYSGNVAVAHTKSQIKKVRQRGMEVLSYFISDNDMSLSNKLKTDFAEMYGSSAEFINVNSVVELSRTMNKKFLSKPI